MYKVGDRVLTRRAILSTGNIGDKCEIISCNVYPRENSYEIRFSNGYKLNGVYESALEIDKEYYRNIKLEELGI